MRTDESVPNSDQVLAALKQKGGEVAHVLEMLLGACWNNWKDILRNLRAKDPTNPTPAEWAKFKDYLFPVLKERGIKDPDALLAFRMQLDAKAAPSAPAKLGSPVEIGDAAAERKSAAREPVALKDSAATISAASSARAVAQTSAFGRTSAEVLSRAKAAIEAGENPHIIAEMLACANEHFHTSQREISRAVGWHPSKVSRVLRWHRSGYKEWSPFGPTTRAGRAAGRKNSKGSGGDGRRSPR
jgi:hypothetical protein